MGPQLDLIQGFTADRERLVEALDRPEALPARVEDRLTPEQYAEGLKSGVQYHQLLDLPRGTAFVRLVIEDRQGRVGSTEIALQVQP